MPDNKKVQRIMITILMVAVFLMMLLLISKEFYDLHNAKEVIKQEEVALEQLKSQYEYLTKLKEKAPEYEELLKVYQQKIPDTLPQNELINYVQQIASLSNIQLIQIAYEGRIPAGQYIEIPMTMTLEGSYYSILSFLNNARDGKHLIRIDDLNIGTGQVSTENIRVDIAVKAFTKN